MWVKTCYLDASALVKLVLDEPNSEVLREFVRRTANLCTTSLCYAEAFGVLKTKWRKRQLTTDAYYTAVRKLTRDVRNKMRFDEVEWLIPSVQDDIDRIGKKNDLELADAHQLVTLLTGTFSQMGSKSKPVLVTADNGLASAAEGETLRVWNCNGPRPEWM
jgi:predicted nucleic acid-binding protein